MYDFILILFVVISRMNKKKKKINQKERRLSHSYPTFLVILEWLRAEIQKRHNAYLNFKDKFSFLTKMTELSTETVTEKAQSLVKYYTNDLEDDLIQECVHFQSHISSYKTAECALKPDSNSLLVSQLFWGIKVCLMYTLTWI